jgi:acetyltransferase-like isoleucine patch superfamily enzyme
MRALLRKFIGQGAVYSALRVMAGRVIRLRKGLRHVHPTAWVHPRADVRPDLVMGEYAFINADCIVMGGVSIGRYAMLAPRVAVIGADHRFDVPGAPMIFSGRPPIPRTIVEADCWIGLGTVLMQGVRIGRGSIVGANSVVTRDVPPYEIWGGVPARKLRDRFADAEAREAHDRMLDGPLLRPEWAEVL